MVLWGWDPYLSLLVGHPLGFIFGAFGFQRIVLARLVEQCCRRRALVGELVGILRPHGLSYR